MNISLLTTVFCLVIGLAVLAANPRRFPNRVFALFSLLCAAYFFTMHMIRYTAVPPNPGTYSGGTLWIRLNGAVASFALAMVSLLMRAILSHEDSIRKTIQRSMGWFALGALLAALCFSRSYFGQAILPEGYYSKGPGYYLHSLLSVVASGYLLVQAIYHAKSTSGIKRLELQFISVNLTAGCLAVVLLTGLGNVLHAPTIVRAAPPVALFAYMLTAWAITVRQVFNASQVFLALTQRFALVTVTTIGTLGLWRLFDGVFPSPSDLLLSLLSCVSAIFWLDRKSRSWLRLDGEEDLRNFRSAVITIARAEPQPALLAAKFEALLRDRCNVQFVTLLMDQHRACASQVIQLAKDRPGYAILCEAGWATPENLQRRRPSAGTNDLQRFLSDHELALVVTAPRGTPDPSLVLAAGIKSSESPFTYPEVQQLQNIAELMDNILTHARLTAQAALEAKMEHLALMSRGLAHDLKNLLTPVSSFLVHTDGRYERGSAEAEVHGEAKRSVRLMTNYVREALFFSNRLDPHFEETDLERVFTTVRDASAARALERGVTIALAAGVPRHLTADAVLLERLLGNLINNAIDASAPGKTVTLRCVEPEPGRVRFEVVDDGCGIPPENLTHIFEPYFTTKQFGDDVRGFGLGLTICEKIVNLHQGTILVRSEPGRGTHVTVDLPAAPSAFLPAPPSAAAA